MANEALADAGSDDRIDRRTLKAQGIERTPVNYTRAELEADGGALRKKREVRFIMKEARLDRDQREPGPEVEIDEEITAEIARPDPSVAPAATKEPGKKVPGITAEQKAERALLQVPGLWEGPKEEDTDRLIYLIKDRWPTPAAVKPKHAPP